MNLKVPCYLLGDELVKLGFSGQCYFGFPWRSTPDATPVNYRVDCLVLMDHKDLLFFVAKFIDTSLI
jgi:hypothetical protein